MRYATLLFAGSLFASAAPAMAQSQPSASPDPTAPDQAATEAASAEPETAVGDIVVTARRREESLKNVPIAITAISGDRLKELQVNSVKDVANYTPGLNINSDSVGRAFVSIRGIGTTLIETVQPGVGIFIDGIYQPNTSYLNSPIVDVARIEVLRGPQGTLFGNNTLGGAINVITRQPGNEWTGRVDAAYARPDDYQSLSGSVSGPIVRDLLQFRIGAAYHKQDGFMVNTLTPGDMNPLRQKSVGGTMRFIPTANAVFTLNANYDQTYGGSTAYNHVSGPKDYRLDGATNVLNRTKIDYYGVSLKGEFQVDPLRTKITAVAAYNRKKLSAVSDGDFGPVDLLRSRGSSRLVTKTGELRFDTQWNDNVSTLFGVFADRYVQNGVSNSHLDLGPLLGLPAGTVVRNSVSSTRLRNDNRAAFGTVFIKFGTTDLAIGGRYDHQRLIGGQVDIANTGATPSAFSAPIYRKNAFQPRVTLTQHWTPDFMSYASVAKGIRGGGQNGPGTRPQDAIYKGDSVWTYEIGSKYGHGPVSINADIFYNDYRDFIGQNSLAPNSTGAGFVAINLNTGKVRSYGAEIEAHAQLSQNWRVDAGLSYLHARITDDSQYFATTGTHVSTNHIIFTPDYNYNLSTTYTLPLAANALVFDAGLFGKGSRYGSSLDPNVAPKLSAYAIVNGSIALRLSNGLTLAVFGTNLFNTKYIESYIDKSALVRAGLAPLASNLAIQGDRRRYGLRASVKF
jgi:iron complex outermembrane receptor protein